MGTTAWTRINLIENINHFLYTLRMTHSKQSFINHIITQKKTSRIIKTHVGFHLRSITNFFVTSLTLYLQCSDSITFVKVTIICSFMNLYLQLDDSGDILQMDLSFFWLYLLLNKSFKVQMVVRACWQILWVTNYQIKDDNLKWHCKIHSKRLNIKFKDQNL